MNLYLLKHVDPENTFYFSDCKNSFLVRATTKVEARLLASKQSGKEGEAFWRDVTRTKCLELSTRGKPEVILENILGG